MAITINNPQSANATTSGTTLTMASYNSQSLSDDVLVVFVGTERTLNFAAAPTGVTFDGSGSPVALTLIDSQSEPDPPASFVQYGSMWYLDGPVGTGDIVITWSPIQFQRLACAVVLGGAKQGGPTNTAKDHNNGATNLDITINLSQANMTVIGGWSSGNELATLTPNQIGQVSEIAVGPGSTSMLISSKSETSSGNSTSGADTSTDAFRLVGVLAAWEEAAAGTEKNLYSGGNAMNRSHRGMGWAA